MNRLPNGTLYPPLTFAAIRGGSLVLPDDLAGSFGVVLIYRGAFCPFCNDMLASFQSSLFELEWSGVKVAAFSVDDQATTYAWAEKHQIHFPVGYAASADAVTAATGASTRAPGDRVKFLEPAGFVLASDGKIITAVYATGPIGRLVPNDVLRLVKFYRARAGASNHVPDKAE